MSTMTVGPRTSDRTSWPRKTTRGLRGHPGAAALLDPATGCRLSAAGCRPTAAGCRLPAAGCRLPAVGDRPADGSCQLRGGRAKATRQSLKALAGSGYVAGLQRPRERRLSGAPSGPAAIRGSRCHGCTPERDRHAPVRVSGVVGVLPERAVPVRGGPRQRRSPSEAVPVPGALPVRCAVVAGACRSSGGRCR
jgi:hypothetical protein